MNQQKGERCSFCAKTTDEFNLKFVRGSNSLICSDCIKRAFEDIKKNDKHKHNNAIALTDLPSPKEIKEFLDLYVVGQDNVKKILSVAVYNHYKKIKHITSPMEFSSLPIEKFGGIEVDKSNILLIGPTGSGKTLLARTLARRLNVPFAIADATTLTEAGYVGEDVENILLKLIQAADNNIQKAEFGIIYIDEIDKIARKTENVSITRDVSGEGVQQALLKIIEGTEASVPPQGGRKHPQQELLKINTENILFICSGAFVGLDKIIEQRVASSSIGFGADIQKREEKDYAKIFSELHTEDLIKFGMIPEFVGRVPIVAALEPLSEEDLVKIIKEPKNSIIKQYQWILATEGVDLVFEESAIKAIAKTAIKHKTGARGLRSIIEKIMLDLMFDIPTTKNVEKIVIDDSVILENKPPKVVKSKNKSGEKSA